MIRLPALLGTTLLLTLAACHGADELTGAEWELWALGVTDAERLDAVRGAVGDRPVTLAIVGNGGVSAERLGQAWGNMVSIEYRAGATDPGTNTHDTGQARVILDLTSRLGVRVKLLVYQPGASFSKIAAAMTQAGREADIVVFFQSFWGPAGAEIVQSIREAEGCLFISPYVEHRSLPTATCVQAHSAKPWAEGLANFVTASPVARKSPGRVLEPADRENDVEVINFVTPSYYASGAGGTCPAAAVTTAVAAWVIASSDHEVTPAEVVALMREAVTMDEAALTEALGWSAEEVAQLTARLTALGAPAEGRRRLDAIGVLNLWAIYQSK
ncbi:MAG: hypothetical protein J7M38_01405 [Armatimonadetes bacterium]|nr:hypothetical protein [Armatimonadota bacterium]